MLWYACMKGNFQQMPIHFIFPMKTTFQKLESAGLRAKCSPMAQHSAAPASSGVPCTTGALQEPSNMRCEGDAGEEDVRRALATAPCHGLVPSYGSKWTPSAEGQQEGSCWSASQHLPTECCLLQTSILPLPTRQM